MSQNYSFKCVTDDFYKELLDDYGLYDYPEWFLKLYEEYKVPYDFITMKS